MEKPRIYSNHLRLEDIVRRVCELATDHFAVTNASPSDRIVEDYAADSLDMVEFVMAVEDEFAVYLPGDDQSPNLVYKSVFTRPSFRLLDIAELVYLQQGSGKAIRRGWWKGTEYPASLLAPFTQLDGRWQPDHRPLFEPLANEKPSRQFRRRSDGMRCILIPVAEVEIGSDAADSLPDERPIHRVRMDSFLIDAEPVSTTAYCRFLNSIGDTDPEVLRDWFILQPNDDRAVHMLIHQNGRDWQPLPGTERWPMILVSWFGANAYSLWANACNWSNYRGDDGTFLPSESQWEYAARGARYQPFPWGDAPPTADLLQFGRHRRSASYEATTLPMADVNALLGMSPFGLHHMAGNVWHWCCDWHDAEFYERSDALSANPVNRRPSGVRSERGGSWIGSVDLCRSSYRRGRIPTARGRCLGFRCVSQSASGDCHS